MRDLNAVKLNLALAVALCIVAALLVVIVPFTPWLEVLVLALIACSAALWVMLRMRRAVRLAEASRAAAAGVEGAGLEEGGDGAQQK